MERLARLLPFRQFGRLRHLRQIASCASLASATSAASGASAARSPRTLSLFDRTEPAVAPSAQPAFARVSLKAGLNTEPARRAPVRVYHGPSRTIMVGTVDAVCQMIDRCIDEERAALGA